MMSGPDVGLWGRRVLHDPPASFIFAAMWVQNVILACVVLGADGGARSGEVASEVETPTAQLLAPWPLDDVQFDDCVTAMADALRQADWGQRGSQDVILAWPRWRNDSLFPLPDEQAMITAVVSTINARSGAMVRFDMEPRAQPGSRLLVTELVLTGPVRSGQRTGYGLELLVRDAEKGNVPLRYVYSFRLSPAAARVIRAEEDEMPLGESLQSEPPERLDDVVHDVEGDIERRVRFPWGRVYFLDRKSAERVMLLSRGESHEADQYSVSLEAMSQKGDLTIRVRAYFADEAGLVVDRTPENEYELPERRRRRITLSTSASAVRTVILIERD